MIFAVLAKRSKSLWPGMVIHSVYNAITSLVWTCDANTALLLFDGQLGWTKWLFKAAMAVPYLLLIGSIYRKSRD